MSPTVTQPPATPAPRDRPQGTIVPQFMAPIVRELPLRCDR
jgi:hypothetical protein